MDNLSLNAGYHYYWDKNVSYGKSFEGVANVKNDVLLNANSYEFAAGAEYGINEKLSVSAGYLYTFAAPKAEYQSDLSYSLNTLSIGLGGKYMVTEKLGLDLGFLNTTYAKKSVTIGSITNDYEKTAWVASIGVTYSLTK
jgi:long-chain fatty acid transport protein